MTVLLEKQQLVHFFLCHLKSVFERLRAWWPLRQYSVLTLSLILLEMLLILCLFEDPQELKLLPELLLEELDATFLHVIRLLRWQVI